MRWAPNLNFPLLLRSSLQGWANPQQGCIPPASQSPQHATPAFVFPLSILHWLTDVMRNPSRSKTKGVSFSCWKGILVPGSLQEVLEQVGACKNGEWIQRMTFASCRLLARTLPAPQHHDQLRPWEGVCCWAGEQLWYTLPSQECCAAVFLPLLWVSGLML